MTRRDAALRAVFFDLDGTLLDLEIEKFMPPYIERLTDAVAERIPADRFQPALLAAVDAVIRDGNASASNEARFWSAFERLSGVRHDEIADLVERFYAEEFPRLSYVSSRVSVAAEVVAEARRRVDCLVLATNPIFPARAIAARMEWAGLDPSLFDFVTTYEVMRVTKPHARYYAEICGKFHLDPVEVLMIGNDPKLDIAGAAEARLWTYLVDDLNGPPSTPSELVLEQRAPHGRGALADVPAFIDLLKGRQNVASEGK